MLYGFSLLFGFTGQTNLYLLADQVRQGGVSALFVGGAAMLVLVGFGFKIAAVPFHFWTPDVYEGAPTPITAFISTASKAAGFAVLLRFLLAFRRADERHVGGRPDGDGRGDDDARQSAGPGADQHQAPAGLFVDRPCRVRADRRRRAV